MDGTEFTTRRSQVNTATEAAVLELWDGQSSWRDADAARFIAEAAPIVQAGQTTVGALTSVYLADFAGDAFDTSVAPPPVPVDLLVEARGVPAQVVYQRPYVEVYTALAAGQPLTAAVDLGRTRLSEITDLDLQHAYSVAADHVFTVFPEEYQPQYWRRVTTGSKSCALCVVASTHRYTRGGLNPIHRRCDCRVEPDYSGSAGRTLDTARLNRVHDAVAELTGTADRGGRAPDYRQLVVEMTAEHGELGPMLVRPRDRFTGPDGI